MKLNTARPIRVAAHLIDWLDNHVFDLIRQIRLSYLPPLMVYKLETGLASLPSLFLCLLWILFVANCDICLATDASHFTVMALGAFWDAGDGFLYFSRNGIVCFPATMPSSIEMGFEVANAFGY